MAIFTDTELKAGGNKKGFIYEFVVADESSLKSDWGCAGRKNGRPRAFFCAFCGHDFILGDEYRMCYTNDIPGASGNPLTCRKCWDAAGGWKGLREKWQELWKEYDARFKWWAVR
jgi:hypothetical protein